MGREKCAKLPSTFLDSKNTGELSKLLEDAGFLGITDVVEIAKAAIQDPATGNYYLPEDKLDEWAHRADGLYRTFLYQIYQPFSKNQGFFYDYHERAARLRGEDGGLDRCQRMNNELEGINAKLLDLSKPGEFQKDVRLFDSAWMFVGVFLGAGLLVPGPVSYLYFQNLSDENG